MNPRDFIRNRRDEPPEMTPVPIPEWEGIDPLYAKPLTVAEKKPFRDALPEAPLAFAQWQVYVVAGMTCNADGKLAFAEDDGTIAAETVDALQNAPACVIERLFDEIDKKNVLTKGAAEELRKNFETTRTSGSNSRLPEALEEA